MANSRSLRPLGHGEIGKVKWQILQSLPLGTPINWQNQNRNSRSIRPLGQGEIGKVKRRTLAVSAHWDTEKLA